MDPVSVPFESFRTAVVVGLLVLLPGVGLGPRLAPGASTPLAKLARAFGIGILATTIACTVLAVLGLLRPTIVATVLAGLTILPLHAGRPARPRFSRRARAWSLAGAASVVLAAGIVVGPAALAAGDGPLLAPTSWAVVMDAVVLAAAGGLPAEAPAWGAGRPVGLEGLPATAHLAAAIQLLPGDLVTSMIVYRAALTVAATVLATVLLRRWLSTWAAVVGAALFAGLAGFDRPMLGDPAIALPLVLVLFSIWLGDRAIVERSPALLATAALAAGMVAIQRVDLFAAAVAGIGSIAVGRWIVAPGGGPELAGGLGHRWGRRIGLRPSLGRTPLRPIAIGLALIVASSGIGVFGSSLVAVVAPAGSVLGSVGNGPDGAPLVGEDEIPPGWTRSGDETWDFRLAAAVGVADPAPPLAASDPRFGAALVAAFVGVPIGGAFAGGLAALLVLIVSLAAWPTLDQRRQRLVATLAAFALLVALTAAVRYSTGGPSAVRHAVLETIVPLEWLVVAAAAALAGWLAARAASRRGHGATGPLALAAIGLVITLAMAPAAASGSSAGGPSAAGLAAYRWIASQTPSHSRVLANAWTDGIIAAVAGRAGILDGRAPDPDDRDEIGRTTALALGARVAFLGPSGPAAQSYLGREGVTHLVVAVPDGRQRHHDLGGGRTFEVDLDALGTDPRYELVAEFGDRVYIFEIVAHG